MIVGLKKRAASKKFYEIGILERKETYSRTRTLYDRSSPSLVIDFRREWSIVRTFKPVECGRGTHRHKTNQLCKPSYLVAKICDNISPVFCKNENCPYRFKCFTNV